MIISSTNPVSAVARGAGPHSVCRARAATRAFTENLNPAPDRDLADTLVMVVSELVTNAVRHGGGRYTLQLSAHPGALSVAVTDPSPVPPRERTPDRVDGGGGFGWHMIRASTSGLSVTPGPGPGKTVRAQLPR
ncbi:ATP-binding protein [Streptomyces sp. NPDC050738]|uniref:ATP-binding protein n=1 Tax=Streptomyces sp. NPDC050738 TaxID=3154744 RepID=UPI003442AB98